MRPSVKRVFETFTTKLEGYTPYMYLDVKGYVTTGIGNLIDSPDAALRLQWLHKSNGKYASKDEVAQTWAYVKSRQDLKNKGGGAFANLTDLVLTNEAITTLVMNTANNYEARLKQYFPAFDTWPADAQLGALSMAWSVGPAFAEKYPRMRQALAKIYPDFEAAGDESHISTIGNPGVEARNQDNAILFSNANIVQRNNLDPDTLYWPQELISSAIAIAKSPATSIAAFGAFVAAGATFYVWRNQKRSAKG